MLYDTEELRKIARRMRQVAQKNLRKSGYLSPVGLAYRSDGYIDTFTFQWDTLEEKRKSQREFQMELVKRDAKAAVVISETWAKFADDGPIDPRDLNRSVRDMPGRKDAILVEAGSPFGRVVIVQTFTKIKPGRILFDDPREFTVATGGLTSEFLDAIWPVRPTGQETWH
ncbi:MAG TPA: hypothetical protein VMC85_12870 [Desulfomonilaceae bacterium]|nr:hypothetical protein [Desulfomonilaceae bacterium]